MKKPEECQNIEDVRAAIDEIDMKLIDLLAERFLYVKEVVKYKENSLDSIIAHKRREEVINTRKKWATEKGLDPEVIAKLYILLTEYFISEEIKMMKNSKNL